MTIGTVQKLEGEYAIVKIQRQDMCGDCHACDAVHESKECTLKCMNSIHSQVGDEVEISVDHTTFLKATYIMYGFPLLGLVTGLAIGYLCAQFIPNINAELLMILGAIIGMLIAFVVIKKRDENNKYKKMLPRIIDIKNSTS